MGRPLRDAAERTWDCEIGLWEREEEEKMRESLL